MLTVRADATTFATRPAYYVYKPKIDQLRVVAIGLRVFAEPEQCAEYGIRAIVVPGSFGNVTQCRGMSGGIIGRAPICGSICEVVKVRAAYSHVVWSRGKAAHLKAHSCRTTDVEVIATR